MTENEAIKIFVTEKHCLDKSTKGICKINCGDCKENIPITYQKEAYEMAISALKEIQQYREIGTVEECTTAMEYWKYLRERRCGLNAVVEKCMKYEQIGTVEECREAVEKQKPKKPHRNYKKFSGLWCKCGWYLGQKQCLDIKYCPNCGQAIDENLEGMEE